MLEEDKNIIEIEKPTREELEKFIFQDPERREQQKITAESIEDAPNSEQRKKFQRLETINYGQAEKLWIEIQKTARSIKRIEELQGEKKALMIDSVTGLFRRELYFRYAQEKIEQLTNEELRDPKTKLSVAAFDLAYLSYFNSAKFGEHAGGDAVLKTVGQEIKRTFTKQGEGFRYGGDEFGVVTASAKGESISLASQAHNELKDNGLEKAGLNAEASIRIDYGVAHISEGMQAWESMCQEESFQEVTSDAVCTDEKKINQIAELAYAIADRRATQAKIYYSLTKLVELYSQKDENQESLKRFQELFSYMRKGAGVQKEDDLADFIKGREIDEDKVREHIYEILNAEQEIKEQRFRIRLSIIKKIADADTIPPQS